MVTPDLSCLEAVSVQASDSQLCACEPGRYFRLCPPGDLNAKHEALNSSDLTLFANVETCSDVNALGTADSTHFYTPTNASDVLDIALLMDVSYNTDIWSFRAFVGPKSCVPDAQRGRGLRTEVHQDLDELATFHSHVAHCARSRGRGSRC